MPVTVRDIVMVAPDIVRVIIRDQTISKHSPVDMGSAAAEALYATVTRTIDGQSRSCMVIGPNKQWVKPWDIQPTVFLNRTAVKDHTNYPSIGGRTVTAVRYQCTPFDQGQISASVNAVVMEHNIDLILSDDLPEGGPYTISCSGDPFPSTGFTFNDVVTHCAAIHVGQLGHRPEDGDKIGYLSMWVPGHATEGAIEYASAYGVDEFNVINNHGDVVFTGDVELMLGPTEQDYSGGGISGGLIALTTYVSTTVPPKQITGITKANPAVVTINSHGYSNGQQKVLRGISGMTPNLEGLLVTVANVTTNTFELQGVNTTGSASFNPGVYLPAVDSLCYDTHQANRAATYVYKLDYSDFAPVQASDYRLQIPGMGVSYPFKINPAIHLQTAIDCAKGYLNQCWGIPLHAEVSGWERPTALRDGVGVCTIYESLLPAILESEASPGGATVGDVVGNATWGTANRVTDFFGMWTDAGDWDWHLLRHMTAVYFLLDIGYDRLPSGVRDVQLGGFPPASETWDYTNIYDSIDDMGSAVHAALHYSEPLRRFQAVDGRVYSGCNFYHANSRHSGYQGGGDIMEPSWLTNFGTYLLAADHWSNLRYALVAAKLGKIFNDAGFTSLGTLWVDSAELAFAWGNAIYTGYLASGIANASWIAHYITRLNIKSKLGWTDSQLTTKFDTINTQAGYAQLDAAAALFAATGDSAYQAILDAKTTSMPLFSNVIACWEYSRASGGNSTYKNYYDSQQSQLADQFYYEQYLSGLDSLYRNLNLSPTTSWLNDLCFLVYPFLLAGGDKNQNNGYLKLLQSSMSYFMGGNQLSRCWQSGMGSNPPNMTLCRDREADGVDANVPIGLGCYAMFYNLNIVGGGYGSVAPLNISTDVGINYTAVLITGNYEASYGTKKFLEPHHRSLPAFMAHIANSFVIYNTEFVTQEQIIRPLALALFLHCWDGNTETDLDAPVTVQCITH